jgi:acyl-CoA synthetase (NDP forming)
MIGMENELSSPSRLESLLRPTSVAIVGASDKVGSFGASVLSNLLGSGYSGTIQLVNPKRNQIDGRPCLSSVKALPEGIDCAVLAIPKEGVLEAVRGCAERGVKAVIIFAAGFSETGEIGRLDQEELVRIASESGMIIEGPNCLGMVNAIEGTALTFVTTPKLEFKGLTGVGIISQSGAMAAVLGVAFRHHALDLTFSISTGNEAVTGVEDYVEFLIEDTHTSVIALLVEQFRQPGRFMHSVARARERGKHIVLLHPGFSSAARASAATHTGAIAGDYEVMRTKVVSVGVILVETVEELVDVTQLLLRCPRVPSGGTAVLTESGAFKALTLDLCDRISLPLPTLASSTCATLRSILPEFIHPSNPLDITAQGLVDPDLYTRILPPLLSDGNSGSVVITIILTDEATGKLKLPPILRAISSLDWKKPIIFAGLDEGAWIDPAFVAQLRDNRVPFFPTAERAFRAIARLSRQSQTDRVPQSTSIATPLPKGVLTEIQSKRILATAGLPVPEGEIATTIDQGVAIADRIGYPVAIKAQSSKLLHKTEVGAVVLNLRNRNEFLEGWDRLQNNVTRNCPDLKQSDVLVERMALPGVELIIGARNDPGWGPVLVIGLGGIFAEALRDTRLLVPDSSNEEIVRELLQLRGAPLLQGFRGGHRIDLVKLAHLIRRLGDFVLQHPEVSEIDLNPVMVYPNDAVILDALIVVK